MLRIAAGLAVGVPVELREVITGLDECNLALVVAAIHQAGGREMAGGWPGPFTTSAEVAMGGTGGPRSPSSNDGVTVPCPVCGAPVAAAGRRRYCSDACRQAGHRRRHGGPSGPPELPPGRPRRPVTVYACVSCEARYLGDQRCPDCNRFCAAVGVGGCCPACGDPVAYGELSSD